jgi:ribosomal protein S18 acetylase RimI-like enzyme
MGHARGVLVRALGDRDVAWKQEALRRVWGSTSVARLGELVDAMPLDGFVAIDDTGEPVGLLTYALRGNELEVVTIHADRPGGGVGRALMDAARKRADDVGARRLWLVTTNDNIRALAFYQRWGMDVAALHRDMIARSRAVKPKIPTTGEGGVPLRHELELELLLRQ